MVGDGPTGYDPLTAQEVNGVLAAVQPAQGTTSVSGAPSQPEVLLVERHDAKQAAHTQGSQPRQADLYAYDYATDTLIHTTVNVQSGAVVATEALQDVQLPLTANEEQRALGFIQSDGALWSTLAERYQQITGTPLRAVTQLEKKVAVFQADVMPDRVNAAAAHCGRHRCAQVLLFTTDKTLLEIMPIVDLSLGQVVQVLNQE